MGLDNFMTAGKLECLIIGQYISDQFEIIKEIHIKMFRQNCDVLKYQRNSRSV